jgi:hypothetical protein
LEKYPVQADGTGQRYDDQKSGQPRKHEAEDRAVGVSVNRGTVARTQELETFDANYANCRE